MVAVAGGYCRCDDAFRIHFIGAAARCSCLTFKDKEHTQTVLRVFLLVYYTDSIYKVYKDKLQNCSCNQFHYIGTYKQAEKNSMTKNRGGNDGSEK